MANTIDLTTPPATLIATPVIETPLHTQQAPEGTLPGRGLTEYEHVQLVQLAIRHTYNGDRAAGISSYFAAIHVAF